ncbi:MAG: hypothetical protein ACJARX_000405 [Psychroserpens sp.]|jgi:hypothetical protein|uniref:hypothetical protein n=1 Tax=Psychroserpens sp. TaxID=2020870 RepID=UPI0039E428CA
MEKSRIKRNLVLGILFFLPVAFLLMLYPSSHNYDPLDIVEEDISDLDVFTSGYEKKILLKDHITVLGFFGNEPENNLIAAANLKELVYDSFLGFKKFQVVIVLPKGTEAKAKAFHKEINNFEDMRFWHYVFGEPNDIKRIFNSLKLEENLDDDLFTDHVFIIDKDLNQRGRLDDRTDNEKEKKDSLYTMYSYDCIDIYDIKNKMSDDLRILLTEYRQKRKGKFDSSSRRADDLKDTE